MEPEQTEPVVRAPLIARPLRLAPFAALSLAPGRTGGAATARAFARPYRTITDRFQRWERSGQVRRDARPHLYLHEYTAGGMTIRGLVGALVLDHTSADLDEVAILPHEAIHADRTADLAERMAEMRLNPAPILLVHRATDRLRRALREARAYAPGRQFADRTGQYHRIWSLADPDLHRLVDAELAGCRAVLADGHHRFAASFQLRHRNDAPPMDAGLAMLVDHGDTPLFLGAIHRVLSDVTLADLGQLSGVIQDTDAGPAEAVSALAPDTLVATDGRAWTTLRLQAPDDRLPVEWLHAQLIPALPRPPTGIGYAHSVDEALRAVARSRAVVVLMPAPAFDDVLRSARAGRVLPEKATSFQPKPSVGVLIRSLHAG